MVLGIIKGISLVAGAVESIKSRKDAKRAGARERALSEAESEATQGQLDALRAQFGMLSAGDIARLTDTLSTLRGERGGITIPDELDDGPAITSTNRFVNQANIAGGQERQRQQALDRIKSLDDTIEKTSALIESNVQGKTNVTDFLARGERSALEAGTEAANLTFAEELRQTRGRLARGGQFGGSEEARQTIKNITDLSTRKLRAGIQAAGTRQDLFAGIQQQLATGERAILGQNIIPQSFTEPGRVAGQTSAALGNVPGQIVGNAATNVASAVNISTEGQAAGRAGLSGSFLGIPFNPTTNVSG